MKTLKFILTILIIASLTLAGLSFHGIGHAQYLGHHLIVGYPEMVLSILFTWVLTMLFIIIIELEQIKSRKFLSKSVESERAKIQESFENERKAYMKLNDEFESFKPAYKAMRSENQALATFANNLVLDNKQFILENQTFKVAMAEQAKAIQSKDYKIEELLLKLKPKLFRKSNIKSNKTKKS